MAISAGDDRLPSNDDYRAAPSLQHFTNGDTRRASARIFMMPPRAPRVMISPPTAKGCRRFEKMSDGRRRASRQRRGPSAGCDAERSSF